MNPQHELMALSAGAIPGAISKAERYRLLNEPWQAESICRDVLIIEPNNEAALILLLLSLTDQFEQGVSSKEPLRIAESISDEYQRAYYSGIVHERQAIAQLRQHPDYRSRREVYKLLQNAMEWYRKAQAIRPVNNDDAVLRWNTCVRFLQRNWNLH
jgi:hypothetical protein